MSGDGDHGAGLGINIGVFVALLVLTFVTVAIAHVDLGPANDAVAVGIAVLKASLVIVVFMHVKWEHNLVGLFAAMGFMFLLILLVMLGLDVEAMDWTTDFTF